MYSLQYVCMIWSITLYSFFMFSTNSFLWAVGNIIYATLNKAISFYTYCSSIYFTIWTMELLFPLFISFCEFPLVVLIWKVMIYYLQEFLFSVFEHFSCQVVWLGDFFLFKFLKIWNVWKRTSNSKKTVIQLPYLKAVDGYSVRGYFYTTEFDFDLSLLEFYAINQMWGVKPCFTWCWFKAFECARMVRVGFRHAFTWAKKLVLKTIWLLCLSLTLFSYLQLFIIFNKSTHLL